MTSEGDTGNGSSDSFLKRQAEKLGPLIEHGLKGGIDEGARHLTRNGIARYHEWKAARAPSRDIAPVPAGASKPQAPLKRPSERVFFHHAGATRSGHDQTVTVVEYTRGRGKSKQVDYQVTVTAANGTWRFPVLGSEWRTHRQLKLGKKAPDWAKKLGSVGAVLTHGLTLPLLAWKEIQTEGHVVLTVVGVLETGLASFEPMSVQIPNMAKLIAFEEEIANLIRLAAPTA